MKSVLPKPMELELEKGASNPSESAALKIESRNNAHTELMNQFGGNKKKRKTNKRKSNKRKSTKRKIKRRKTNKRK